MRLVSFSHFHLARCFAEHPVGAGLFVTSVIACIGTFCAIAVVNEQSLLVSREKSKLIQPPVSLLPRIPPNTAAVSLPPFISGELVKNFNSIADDMHVPLDEVAYAMDSATAVPYRRYRITLTAKAGYADVRKFIAALASELPNVSLESIRCARPDAGATVLSCELAFSAFFSKEGHG